MEATMETFPVYPVLLTQDLITSLQDLFLPVLNKLEYSLQRLLTEARIGDPLRSASKRRQINERVYLIPAEHTERFQRWQMESPLHNLTASAQYSAPQLREEEATTDMKDTMTNNSRPLLWCDSDIYSFSQQSLNNAISQAINQQHGRESYQRLQLQTTQLILTHTVELLADTDGFNLKEENNMRYIRRSMGIG